MITTISHPLCTLYGKAAQCFDNGNTYPPRKYQPFTAMILETKGHEIQLYIDFTTTISPSEAKRHSL